MSILIKGMKMPTSCMLCNFCVEEADPANGEMCMVTGTLMPPCTRERLDNCPLVLVPTSHGRLIDADVLLSKDYQVYNEYGDAIGRRPLSVYDIQDAPTIIPAEEVET